MKVTGPQLREERQEAGVSNVGLAVAMGVNPSTVTRIEQAADVRPRSVLQFRDGLRRVAAARVRKDESVRAAAAALVSAGEALLETGRKLAGAVAGD